MTKEEIDQKAREAAHADASSPAAHVMPHLGLSRAFAAHPGDAANDDRRYYIARYDFHFRTAPAPERTRT